jgi:hypothetical protein
VPTRCPQRCPTSVIPILTRLDALSPRFLWCHIVGRAKPPLRIRDEYIDPSVFHEVFDFVRTSRTGLYKILSYGLESHREQVDDFHRDPEIPTDGRESPDERCDRNESPRTPLRHMDHDRAGFLANHDIASVSRGTSDLSFRGCDHF